MGIISFLSGSPKLGSGAVGAGRRGGDFGVALLEDHGALTEVAVEETGVKARIRTPLTLCLLQTDQQAEARSYLSEEMIAGEWG